MPGESILLRIGLEAIVGPAVTAALSRVLYRSKQRKKCSSLYTMLLYGPKPLRDEIAKLGVDEGCWTKSFIETFRKANNIKELAGEKPIVEDLITPGTVADVVTGDLDDAFVKTVKRVNKDLLEATLKK